MAPPTHATAPVENPVTGPLPPPDEHFFIGTVDVVVATHNVGAHPDPDIITELFRRGAVVVALTEMADQPPARWPLPPWVGAYWPARSADRPNANENPILYHRDHFRPVRAGSRLLTGRTPVGAEGAGGDVMHVKWLNWVRLHHVELDEDLVFGNMHTVPSILANKARGDLMRAQVTGAVQWAALRPPDTIVTLTGDLNADARRGREGRFLAPLWDAGFDSCWTVTGHRGGSMRRRGIDHVALRRHDRARIVAMDVPQRLGYDHRPVLATIRVQPTAGLPT